MEQDVEKFIRDPTQQQYEFPQLPTSYLRLAAHRVAQHYSLQSMVLLDNSLPDGSGSRIIVRKTSECRLPLIRLADIPVNLPSEEGGVIKVAIKQRPQKRSQNVNNANSNSLKTGNAKSVEERKEDYNRARARIFNSSNNISSVVSGKPENEPRLQDNSQHGYLGIPRIEEKSVSGITDVNSGRGLIDSSTSSSRSARSRTEKEPVGRNKPNNRVAIFRDREIDRKDPDYDRNYDRCATFFYFFLPFLFFLLTCWANMGEGFGSLRWLLKSCLILCFFSIGKISYVLIDKSLKAYCPLNRLLSN